jgi:hypothetical protein
MWKETAATSGSQFNTDDGFYVLTESWRSRWIIFFKVLYNSFWTIAIKSSREHTACIKNKSSKQT